MPGVPSSHFPMIQSEISGERLCPSPLRALAKTRLLATLPEPEFRKLLPNLEPVTLVLGQTLHEAGGKLNHVFFPTSAIVSLLYVMEDGASVKIAVVGNDGIVGIALFVGGETRSGSARRPGYVARGSRIGSTGPGGRSV